jgi:hypothetical protein
VIEQQINLYDERFREKKLLLSAAQVATLVVALLLGISGWSFLIEMKSDMARQENLQVKADQQRLNQELHAASTELAQLVAASQVDQELAGVSREVGARKKVLAFVNSNQFGSGQGYSSYLVALSELQVDNVWLEEISLADDYVKIRGSALSADLVPVYFNQFGKQSVFNGRRFEIFQLKRQDDTDWKVDFEIATSEIINE